MSERTDTKRYRLRQALLGLLREHEEAGMLPTSARFLFYELVQREIIAKHSEGARRADQDMNDALTSLREDGTIPWEWIVDETRHVENYRGYKSIRDGLLALIDGITLDPWEGNEPLVLTESRSLAGVLRTICQEYRVQIAATNGQTAGFLHTKVAPLLNRYHTVIYLGDWDKAGNDIEKNTRSVLERIAGELDWDRLALTDEQAEGLPQIWKTDKRCKGGGGHWAVETEALSQAEIVRLLRERLDYLLPEALEVVQQREETERDILRAYLEAFEG